MAWWLGGELAAGGELLRTAPDGVVWSAVLGALVAWGLAVPGERRPLMRAVELVAWGLALAGLVFALARPVWVEEAGRQVPGRVAVLVDASASMAIEEEGRPRHTQAAAWIEQLRAEPGVEFLQFGERLDPGAPTTFDRGGTDLASVLSSLDDRYAGERLAGVVVITDGIDRGRLRAAWQAGDDPEPPRLPGPLTVVGVGSKGAVRDLAVVGVEAGGYAYLRTPVSLEARLSGSGFEGQTVRAELLRDGAVVRSQDVTLDDAGQATVTFKVVPQEAGRSAWAVRVPTYDGDAVPGNDELPLVLRVVRDQIRVLQVAGSPSWDVKFLRRFLKGDPSVELVSFFILRTWDDARASRWGDDELSLIAFPYRDLFTSEIGNFDLVVFQNFDYREFFGQGEAAELLQNVRDQVVEGGHGFVMVGGDRSFDLGGYGTTPLAELLPVQVASAERPPVVEPFQPTLTAAGARHVVTRMTADPVENEAWWARLHPVDGTHRGIATRPGATVLLEHPSAKGDDGKPLPVVAVREAGKGRAMALAADSSWRWSLSEAAEGRGNQAYLRFWKQAIRWLIQDPTAERVTIDPERDNVPLGQPARLVVRARDAGFQLLGDARVELTIRRGTDEQVLSGVTGPEGEAVFEVPSTHRGAHRVHASVLRGSDRVGEADTVYAVTSRDPELEEVAPDHAYLRWLAGRSGGTFLSASERGAIARDPSADRTAWDRKEVALWRAPILMLWIAGFAGVAWIVRRRGGLR